MSFDDAIIIARGCQDYGGGYRYDDDKYEAFQHGIRTVLRALLSAKEDPSDTQVRALYAIGQPEGGAPVPDDSSEYQYIAAIVEPLRQDLVGRGYSTSIWVSFHVGDDDIQAAVHLVKDGARSCGTKSAKAGKATVLDVVQRAASRALLEHHHITTVDRVACECPDCGHITNEGGQR